MLKVFRFLWGDLTKEEFKKFGILSATFFFIIGSYWLLRPLKDGIFRAIVGIEYQPLAKIASLCVLIPLILFYSKLVDLFEKHKLFYIICSLYGLIFLTIAYLLTTSIGLVNTVSSPYRIFGWVTYIAIESFGSIVVALFWSFVASFIDSSAAKRGFAFIISGAQVGSILGPTLATYSEKFGIPFLGFVAACGIFMIPVLVMFFMQKVGYEYQLKQKEKKQEQLIKSKTGIFEGLKLLFTKPYLLGILGIATFYEVIGTILDFQMKMLASQKFGANIEAFTSFMGRFGQVTNTIALLLALLGTSYLMRRFGLTFCLLTFPIIVGFVVGGVYINPTLLTVFISMVFVKGLSYSLNNPSKEMMYIPTSKDIKFKAKSWIDMFGGRSAKATGSAITATFRHSLSNLMFYGTIISLGFVGFWIMAALFVGKKFYKLTTEGKIVQ